MLLRFSMSISYSWWLFLLSASEQARTGYRDDPCISDESMLENEGFQSFQFIIATDHSAAFRLRLFQPFLRKYLYALSLAFTSTRPLGAFHLRWLITETNFPIREAEDKSLYCTLCFIDIPLFSLHISS